MKSTSSFAIGFLFISLAALACGSFARPEIEAGTGTDANLPTATVIPKPTPTTAIKLQLEIVRFQAWTDRDGNVRVNVLMRNPYDFPIAPAAGARARLVNGTGESIRDQDLYFLDGISGGNGFLLPGEMVAANVCFTCERAPLKEEWKAVEFVTDAEDASEKWKYSTEVEITVGDVSFDGDSPLFSISGTVKNNSDVLLGRISARVFVFDQEGNLVGAGEASAWDVAPGASASFSGYGIGQAPVGPVTYESNALGVNY
jgi:hypothetical protein